MLTKEFDYNLPRELIAQEPLKERDASRLLVVNRKDKSLSERVFRDITEYFSPRSEEHTSELQSH